MVLTEAIVHQAGDRVEWVVQPWDELMGILRTSHDLDAVAGMEQSGNRPQQFLLGRPQYQRRSVLVSLAGPGQVARLDDLVNQPVAGDRGSFGEQVLNARGLGGDVRLLRTATKEQSFALLMSGRVVASLMPDGVARYLAKLRGIPIAILDLGDPGTPVGLAFSKDRPDLAARLDRAVEALERSGDLRRLIAAQR